MKGLRYMICFALTALMAAACYDDSEVWDKFEEIDSEMSEMVSRIDSLEQKMADNVDAIQSMISVGSIASWNYNAETGKGTITLVDGKVITINQNISGYSVITVEKDADGTYYWAISRDGMNIPLLDADNKKVPVSVTPALKISKDNEWLISVDGGKTWVKTGISYYAEDEDEDEIVTEVVVFEKAETDGDYLILTLAGGTEIKVAIVGEAVFKASADTLWFSRTKMEKSVAVEMKNVKAFTITEKPEGWKASFDETYLFVTSPDNFEEFPAQGTVKVFALYDNGSSPEILQLEVMYEPMLTLTRANEVISARLSAHTAEDFTGYVLSSWLKADYDPLTAAEWFNANAETLEPRTGNATYALSDIIPSFDRTKEYIVSAVPYLPASQVVQGNMEYRVSDIVAIETIAVEDAWQIRNLRYDNADLQVVMDVPEYFGGFLEKEIWDTRGKTDILAMLAAGNLTPVKEIQYDGPANAFPDGEYYGHINPATEYVIWYVPTLESGAYTEDMFVEKVFTTPDVVSDPAVAVPSYEVRDVTASGFTADVTPVGNVYKTYAAIVKSTAIPETDAELVRYLINVNTFSEGKAVNTVTNASLDPSDEVYLLAVSLTAEGGYGAILKEKVELKQLVFTESLGVEVTSVTFDELANATLELSFKGSPVTMTYMAATFTYYPDDVIQDLMAKGQLGDATTVAISKLGGKLFLSGLAVGSEHTFYALVTDAEGNHSYLYCSLKFTPSITVNYVLNSDPDYTYGMPQISGTLSGTGNAKKFTMSVTMPEECLKYWLFCGDAEYLPGDEYSNTDKLLAMELKEVGETVHESSINSKTYLRISGVSRIYMVWQDIKGRYHTVYEFNPNK